MRTLVRFICYLFGFMAVLFGLWLLKSDKVIASVGAFGVGIFTSWLAEYIPEPKKEKYKLTSKQIDEIVTATRRDAIAQDIKFLGNDRTEEIIETMDDYSYEDSLIALHVIEKKHPQLITGRKVEL